MRHAKISTTMEVYAQVGMEKKRVAQRKAVDVLFDRKPESASGHWAEMECPILFPRKRYCSQNVRSKLLI